MLEKYASYFLPVYIVYVVYIQMVYIQRIIDIWFYENYYLKIRDMLNDCFQRKDSRYSRLKLDYHCLRYLFFNC